MSATTRRWLTVHTKAGVRGRTRVRKGNATNGIAQARLAHLKRLPSFTRVSLVITDLRHHKIIDAFTLKR